MKISSQYAGRLSMAAVLPVLPILPVDVLAPTVPVAILPPMVPVAVVPVQLGDVLPVPLPFPAPVFPSAEPVLPELELDSVVPETL